MLLTLLTIDVKESKSRHISLISLIAESNGDGLNTNCSYFLPSRLLREARLPFLPFLSFCLTSSALLRSLSFEFDLLSDECEGVLELDLDLLEERELFPDRELLSEEPEELAEREERSLLSSLSPTKILLVFSISAFVPLGLCNNVCISVSVNVCDFCGLTIVT